MMVFKYMITCLLVLTALMLPASCVSKQALDAPAPFLEDRYVPEHSPDVFLILYDAEVGKEPVLKAIEEYKCEIKYDYGSINGMALRKPEDKTLEETMQYFKTVKGVLTVEYDHIIRLTDPVQPILETR